MAIGELKKTSERGVYCIEHPIRKHGVRKDRQLILRYTIKGKAYKAVFGWESQGAKVSAAAEKVEMYKQNGKAGSGAVSLKEELSERIQKDRAEEKRLLGEKQRNVTLCDYFYNEYLPEAKNNKKSRTVGSEVALFKKWIEPLMGDRRIRDIVPLDFQRLKNKVIKGDRCKDDKGHIYYVEKSPRTVHYCVSIITQVWNMAFDNKVVDVQPPRRRTLNLPMIDNERTRAFTPEQVELYLECMKVRSPRWHDISMISLFGGLRASEVFKLEIGHFDEVRKRVFLRSPKKQKSQHLVLNDTAYELLKALKAKHETGVGLFFTNTKGEQIEEVSDTVERVIKELGFNENVTDKRERLTFHSFRHTYATWILDGGGDIYMINRLLRHSSLAMTQKYLHPQEERLRDAAKGLDSVIRGTK